jgi:hypothetical protein
VCVLKSGNDICAKYATVILLLFTHFCLKLTPHKGHTVAGRNMLMKYSSGKIGNRNRDIPSCSKSLNEMQHGLPHIINNVLKKVLFTCVCFSKFGPLYRFLYTTVSMRIDLLFSVWPWSMTSSLIDFNIPECKGWCANDKKYADHRIHDR